jgi:CheY-like chemotaxis protein
MPDLPARLLLVEDEPLVRTSMAIALSEVGYAVRVAEDGFSALSEIRQEMPDILLTDLHMPGMAGFELLSVVRRRFPAIQTIAMSGAFCGSQVPDSVVADAFYPKGGETEALLQILHTLSSTGPRSSDASSALAPQSIRRGGDDPSDAACVTITCPECLRTFFQTLDGLGERTQNTECIHCHTPIHFAIAQLVDEQCFMEPSQCFCLD